MCVQSERETQIEIEIEKERERERELVPEESSLLACLSFPFDATAAPPRRNKRSTVGIFLDGSHCEPAGKPKRRPSTV